MIKLVLECLGARRDDGLSAALQRRQQIGKGLSGTGACLNDQMTQVIQRVRNRLGHPCLSFARLKSGQLRFQGTVGTEEFSEIMHVSGTIP